MGRARYRWLSPAARVPVPVASFPATLVFAEVDDAEFRLDGMAGAADADVRQRPARGPALPTAQPFSMLVDAAGESWLAMAVLTIERWATTDAPLHVQITRRGGVHQARISDGAATILFDVRAVDGPAWTRIEGAGTR